MKQYIDLFTANRDVIDAHSAPLLNACRPRALAWLREHPECPKELCPHLRPDYGLNLTRVNMPVDVARTFRCDVPGVTTAFAVMANDKFVPSDRLDQKLPQGVKFMSLDRAARECPELVEPYYGRIAPLDNVETALNTLLVQDGVFVYVPDGVKLERPLQLVNIFSSPVDLMAVRRLLVVLGRDAEAQLLVCDHTQDRERQYLSCQLTEVSLAAGAKLEAVTVEESSESTHRVAAMYVKESEHARLTYNTTTLTCGQTHNRFTVDLDGERSHAHLAGMAIGSGQMVADNTTLVRHNVPRCTSNQLFKYVLDEHSRGQFRGKILVTPNAPFTEAYQTNRNLLACGDARMHAEPALEIYNDEVKCSHGAATGQLDEEAMFYMRTRGIPEDEARVMLMQAFMSDVIDTVEISGLRERLRHLVDRRFAGADATCETCQHRG